MLKLAGESELERLDGGGERLDGGGELGRLDGSELARLHDGTARIDVLGSKVQTRSPAEGAPRLQLTQIHPQ